MSFEVCKAIGVCGMYWYVKVGVCDESTVVRLVRIAQPRREREGEDKLVC